jgi:hypothetical protein
MLHRALRISAQLGNTALRTLVPNEAMPAIVFGAKSNACVQMRSRGHVSRMRATGAAVRVCVCACARVCVCAQSDNVEHFPEQCSCYVVICTRFATRLRHTCPGWTAARVLTSFCKRYRSTRARNLIHTFFSGSSRADHAGAAGVAQPPSLRTGSDAASLPPWAARV